MIQRFVKLAVVPVVGTCLLLASCGKKAETNDGVKESPVRPPQTSIDTFLEKQDVNCEPNQACPSYITKIVVVNEGKYEFCTGFLIDRDLVATSTSCLPRLMRRQGQDCSRDVFFFFPRSGNRLAERVECSNVAQFSSHEESNPNLWRDDISVLQMSRPINNRKANYVRKGVFDNKQYYSYMIDQQDEFSAIIKRVSCEAVHQNYVNPLAVTESSPSMIFAGCPMTRGGTGAPILDSSGKVRAVVSVGISDDIKKYLHKSGLLENGLKDLFHATNLACAPVLNDHEMLDEKECLKDLTELKVNNARDALLSTTELFERMRIEMETSLMSVSKYVDFGVNLLGSGDTREVEIVPKCFKKLSTWLPNFSSRTTYVQEPFQLPVRTFKRAIDNTARIRGLAIDVKTINYKIEFQLKPLRNSQRSSVYMWIPGDNESGKPFPSISECPSLL